MLFAFACWLIVAGCGLSPDQLPHVLPSEMLDQASGIPAIPLGSLNPQKPESQPHMVIAEPPSDLSEGIPNGVWHVGTDVRPGTYASEGPDETLGSFRWTKVGRFGGAVSDIIPTEEGAPPIIVTITASDMGFSSEGCKPWFRQDQLDSDDVG